MKQALAILFLSVETVLFFLASLVHFGILAQGFALLGTLVGVTMIAIGVGPQTTGDIVFHMLLIVLLVTGLIMTMREIKRRA